MADPITFMVFDDNGIPKTDATPSFTIYRTRSLTNRSSPLIIHRGGGIYTAQPTDTDASIGVAYSIDTGFVPTRVFGTVTDPRTPFDAFEFTDSNDVLWTGAAPSVGQYRDLLGNPITAPSLVAIDTFLYTLTPTSANVTTGVIYRIDAPTNAYPPYYNGAFTRIPGGGTGSAFNTGYN